MFTGLGPLSGRQVHSLLDVDLIGIFGWNGPIRVEERTDGPELELEVEHNLGTFGFSPGLTGVLNCAWNGMPTAGLLLIVRLPASHRDICVVKVSSNS